MPLKKATGEMYSWVSHCHSALAGECPHKCAYCFVSAMAKRFPSMKAKYQGPIRLIEKELQTNFGSGKTIFIENCGDLFAKEVDSKFIWQIIAHCCQYLDNTYIFQTKNPTRYREFWDYLPYRSILGTTIETDRDTTRICNAPRNDQRAGAMMALPNKFPIFVTVEPIMDFDDLLLEWLLAIKPTFVNIGADSKGHNLPEPSKEKIIELIQGLQDAGIEVRQKSNLKRLLK